MAWINFEEVKIIRKSKDINGKSKQRTFFQTMNPWNTKKDGSPKTRNDILKELNKEADKWEKDIKK